MNKIISITSNSLLRYVSVALITLTFCVAKTAQAAPGHYIFSGFIPSNGLTITGELSLNTGSTLLVSGFGFEGTTVPSTLSISLSNGDQVTATRNWSSKDIGGLYQLQTRGDAFVSGGQLLAYFASNPVPFSQTGQSFQDLYFFLPTSLPTNFLSASTPLNYTGLSGQITIANTGYVISNLSIQPVPLPAAAWLFGSGIGLFACLGFKRKHGRAG